MKQLLQDISSGSTSIQDVPVPAVQRGKLLVETRTSLISTGTERMLVDFGRAGMLGKARRQPEKVREVLQKARTDGLGATIEAVRSKLDQPMALGYCNVGIVHATGDDVTSFHSGERVVSNGSHAECVRVPVNLCARIPDNVTDEEASFTVVGAIALQGIRLAKPTLGESFVVMGLGLIGLMTVQLLRAHGCRVLGVDPDPAKLALAREFGAATAELGTGEDLVEVAKAFSRGRGVDGVLLTLASKSSEPVSQAAAMCRKRGRVVLTGVAGLDLNRSDFYEKEVSFQVSCSYGPGRYDSNYEEGGQDYPLGFVRWTEQRNFEAVLDMMSENRLQVEPLISHRFDFHEAVAAYDLLVSGDPVLGIILNYGQVSRLDSRTGRSVPISPSRPLADAREDAPRVSFIGSGNYAGRVLMPAFKSTGVAFGSVVTSGGFGGVHYGRKYGFEHAGTDRQQVLQSQEDDIVVVATRHDTHAALVLECLEAKKHVFVEKPLALDLDGLAQIEESLNAHPEQLLMVGFNRRFAPHVVRIKELLESINGPKTFVMTVNAGAIPGNHWTQDKNVGGGRIVGEACHFIDLLRHLAAHEIEHWHVVSQACAANGFDREDCATIVLQFADGSHGSIHYLSTGHKSVSKERLDVYGGGRVIQLDNYRRLRTFGWPGSGRLNLWRQDKGQKQCVSAFVDAVRNVMPAPISPTELLEVSRVSILAAEAARAGRGGD